MSTGYLYDDAEETGKGEVLVMRVESGRASECNDDGSMGKGNGRVTYKDPVEMGSIFSKHDRNVVERNIAGVVKTYEEFRSKVNRAENTRVKKFDAFQEKYWQWRKGVGVPDFSQDGWSLKPVHTVLLCFCCVFVMFFFVMFLLCFCYVFVMVLLCFCYVFVMIFL